MAKTLPQMRFRRTTERRQRTARKAMRARVTVAGAATLRPSAPGSLQARPAPCQTADFAALVQRSLSERRQAIGLADATSRPFVESPGRGTGGGA